MRQLAGEKRFDLLLIADHPLEIDCELILKEKQQYGTDIPLLVLGTGPRHPFVEQYLIAPGARKVLNKREVPKVREAVQELFP